MRQSPKVMFFEEIVDSYFEGLNVGSSNTIRGKLIPPINNTL
jgi:hypothetical protein